MKSAIDHLNDVGIVLNAIDAPPTLSSSFMRHDKTSSKGGGSCRLGQWAIANGAALRLIGTLCDSTGLCVK